MTKDDDFRYARVTTAEYSRICTIIEDAFAAPADSRDRIARTTAAVFRALGVGLADQAALKAEH